MKILSEKEQLRNKLKEIDYQIEMASSEYDYAVERKKRKRNWGTLSFIIDDYSMLDFICNNKLTQLNLLKEYREYISNRLISDYLNEKTQ